MPLTLDEIGLKGEDHKRLTKALTEAFPTPDTLTMFARHELDVNIASLPGESSLWFRLVDWAVTQGRLDELVRKARESNSGNPALKRFDERMQARLQAAEEAKSATKEAPPKYTTADTPPTTTGPSAAVPPQDAPNASGVPSSRLRLGFLGLVLVVSSVFGTIRVLSLGSHVDQPAVRYTESGTQPPSTSGMASRCPDGMVLIPAPTPRAGREPGRDPTVPRPTLNAFCMDRTEVTVAAWRQCVTSPGAARNCSPAHETITAPDHERWDRFCNGRSRDGEDRGNHPINCVDWNQASEYCQWADKRLPTDQEWEYAARGSHSREYPWGNAEPRDQLCWQRGDEGTCVVGSFPGGATAQGLLDMSGNVLEWTATPWAESNCGDGPAANRSQDQGNATYAYRGGSWYTGNAIDVSVNACERDVRNHRSAILGFRCVADVR